MTTVHLTLSLDQAYAVDRACDLYARIGLGQLNEIAMLVSFGEIRNADGRMATGELRDNIKALMIRAKGLLGHSAHGSFEIGHALVPVGFKRAFEIKKVLEKSLAMHRNTDPEFRGVNYDGLSQTLRYTDDPMPVAEVKVESMTHQESDETEEIRELQAVLSDWNDLVKAIGSPTNGGAIGYATALRADAERYRWLRDPLSGAEEVIYYSRGDYGKGIFSGTLLDAAIDTAREKA